MVMEKCSKCGSDRIWSGEERVVSKGVVEFGIDNLKTFNVRTARIKSWACRNCGYVEKYLDTNRLNEMIEKHSKI